MNNDNNRPQWLRDETLAVGVDYMTTKEAREYDLRHAKFRDVEQDNLKTLKKVALNSNSTLLDIGTGTGGLAIAAAECCLHAVGVDISPKMLSVAREKAEELGMKNVEFVEGGFLSYQHSGDSFDVVVTQLAMHHLPDFWKQIALNRIAEMLCEDGVFLLKDAVFSFPVDQHVNFFDDLLDDLRKNASASIAGNFAKHIRDEFSTFPWVMEGLLERAGFEIVDIEHNKGYLTEYLCRKR